MRVWLIALVMLSAAMSGCFGGDEEPADEHEDDHDLGPETGTNGTMEDVNTPPEVALAADNTTVSAPANVTFTVAAVDAEGDDLAFTLDVTGDGEAEVDGTLVADENGTYAPFEFLYSYDTAGNYSAVLNLTDGEFAVNATLDLVVSAAEDVGEGVDEEIGPIFEDRGWYEFDPATGLCHVKESHYVTHPGGLIYQSPLSGGDWYAAELNGEPGFQVENNFPEQTTGFFSLDLPDCVDGDQILL